METTGLEVVKTIDQHEKLLTLGCYAKVPNAMLCYANAKATRTEMIACCNKHNKKCSFCWFVFKNDANSSLPAPDPDVTGTGPGPASRRSELWRRPLPAEARN